MKEDGVEAVRRLIEAALELGFLWGWTERDVVDALIGSFGQGGFGLYYEDFCMAGYKDLADEYIKED